MGFLDRPLTRGFRNAPTRFDAGNAFAAPPPYGGINLRDDVSSIQPNQARFLDNWLPDSGALKVRPGFENYATGAGSGEVETLATFEGTTSEKMLAAANGNVFDVSTSGSATDLTGSLLNFSEDRWQHANFNNRLFFVNGTDAPLDYNGSAIAQTSWTGLTIANLVNVANVRNRLWFCENGSADVWYGGIGSITGALTKFQLSQIASGGFCQAIGSWSRDAGDGQDDLTVFVMSTGQIIVYQGDPDAASFELVGKFGDENSAPPIGRQCLIKVGGELVVITRLGLLPLSAAMSAASSLDFSVLDPWGKIAALIRTEAESHGAKPGWHGALHNGILYINIPQSIGILSKQVVLVTRTGAWATYSGWNASSIRAFDNQLYFGAKTGGFVRKVAKGDDLGAAVIATARGAFMTPSSNKTNVFTAIRPRIQAQGDVSGFVGVDTDFFERPLIGNSVELVSDINTTAWGDGFKNNGIGGDWGSPWGAKPEPIAKWFSVNGDGRSAAVKLQVFAQSDEVKWLATDILYRQGGIR